MKNKIISSLIAKKWTIKNMTLKISQKKYQLNGIGSKNLKLKLDAPKECPNLQVVAFLPWEKWENFSETEKQIVDLFYKKLQ